MVSLNLFDCRGKRLCLGFLLAAGIFYCGLVHLTRADSHNLYIDLEWPDEIDGDWLAPELMLIHGMHFEDQLSDEQKAELAKWEWFTAAPPFRAFVFGTIILTFNQMGFSNE